MLTQHKIFNSVPLTVALQMGSVNTYYDKQSQGYDKVFDALYFRVYDAVTWKYLLPYLPRHAGGLVLDAAGGTGRWAVRMAENGCKVTLVDASEGMLAVAGRKIEEGRLQSSITLQRGDVTKLDFADETFDLVLCEHALFLFEEPDALLRELQRVLKKNAPLVISAQNRYVNALSAISDKPSSGDLEDALKLLNGQQEASMPTDSQVKVHTWTPSDFKAMLERNGLRVEKIVGKCVTMPLRISPEVYMKTEVTDDLFRKLLNAELALSEKADALALAGHMQAIAFKL